MFTGIVEDVGSVARIEPGRHGGRVLQIRTAFPPESMAIGDSICTNGVCLTATAIGGGAFTADAGPETLSRTTIGQLKVGSKVNLERSVTPSTRLGGHLVMGHVDAVGRVRTLTKRENAWDFRIEAPVDVLRLIIPRGSVAVDGISLTVTARDSQTFGLSIIPHTWTVTSMADMHPNDAVNLEVDVIARYVEGLLSFPNRDGAKDAPNLADLMKKHGF